MGNKIKTITDARFEKTVLQKPFGSFKLKNIATDATEIKNDVEYVKN